MPRRLLRDGRIVADDWVYLAETATDGAGPAESDTTGLILSFDQWIADKPKWLAVTQNLGVVLSPAHRVEQLAPDLPRFRLVGAEFAGPSEGRGYTQGRLLRERYRWSGELRATGYIRRDQLFFLARCGFNSFELPDGELEHADRAFSTFSAEYQPSNDAGLPLRLRHR